MNFYNHQVHCNASPHTSFGGDMCSCNAPDPRIAELEAENAALRKEAEEQDLHIEALEKKYADCPHPKGEAYWCGCSYDKASDVCSVHSPRLKALEAENAALKDRIAELDWQPLTPETEQEKGTMLYMLRKDLTWPWAKDRSAQTCIDFGFTHYRRASYPKTEATS